jgi:hypothetical protein
MPHTLKKSAIIGIGGTGMHAVLHMKKKLLDVYGEIPEMIKFLVVDTTDADVLETDGGRITLDPGEFLKLQVKNPRTLIDTNREIKDWIPDNIPRFALTSGAKQIRALGRLAVFANSAAIDARIMGLISSVNSYRIGRGEKYEIISDDAVVSIVCSISGGTGSGGFLDIAGMARAQLSSTDKLIGYFLLPDIFVGKPATENVEPNAYAALKEISYFMDKGSISYSMGGKPRTIDSGLFNAVYLINKTNKQGTQYNDLTDLREFLGLGLFLQSTATGKGASDIIDNLEAEMLGKNWFGKPTTFSSFGISELVYPGQWYADLYTNKTALDTISRTFLGGDVSEASSFTDDFIRRAQIREHNADEVVDALAGQDDVRSFPMPKEFRKELIAATFSRKDTFVNDTLTEVRDVALKRLADLKATKAKVLADELAGRLGTPQGLEFSRSFLAALAGQLGEFKSEMSDERDSLDKEKGELPGRYETAKSEADTAAKAIFGSKSKLEAAFRKLKQIADREARLIMDIERREKAIDFFTYLLHEVSQWAEKMGAFRDYCDVLTGELSAAIQRIKHERTEIKPFVQEVKPKSLTEELSSRPAEEFLRWLNEERKLTMLQVAELRISELKALLIDFGASDPRIKEVSERSIDDILRDASEDERRRYIETLDQMASPLWQYDQGRIAGDKQTTNIYLFGVADATNTIFVPEKIRASIESPYEPQVVATGDTKRVVCFKVEAAVPAFVVHNLAGYKQRYSAPTGISFHLHKNWEIELPDLFPGTDEAESRRYWSVALGDPFSLIIKRGQYYLMRSEKKGERTKDYLIQLGQGRAESLRAFLAEPEYVQEMKDAIDKINGNLGNKVVAEKLSAYGNQLESQAGSQSEEIRKMIEVELNDIEEYIKSLSSL